MRRCLSILRTAAGASPGGATAAGLVQPHVLAALVRLLAGRLRGSASGGEVEAEAAALLLAISRWAGQAQQAVPCRIPQPAYPCMDAVHPPAPCAADMAPPLTAMALVCPCREPGAAQALAAAGAGLALTSLAANSGTSEAGRLAGEALQHLQQQVGWRSLQQPPLQLSPLQRSASGRPAQPASFAERRPWPPHLGRAASAPAPLPPVPEQREVAGKQQGGRRRASAELAQAGAGASGAAADAWAKVQRWQTQQAQQAQHSGGAAAAAPRPPPLDSASGGSSLAHLLAALGSPVARHQLAAAEQLAALAASGPALAAGIAAAGGSQALLACIRDSSASPFGSGGAPPGAGEPALSRSICNAALRALCTLCQQDPAAAAALPPAAAAGLQVLLAGPDPEQRQLAAMLLAAMQAAAGDRLFRSHGQSGAATAAAGSSADLGSDLLQSDLLSFLSELPSFPSERLSAGRLASLGSEPPLAGPLSSEAQQGAAVRSGERQPKQLLLPQLGGTPASVLHRQHSTDSGGTPGAEGNLPPRSQRQLGAGLPSGSGGGGQPQPLPRQARPPLPTGRPGSGASSSAGGGRVQLGMQLWQPGSAGSGDHASPFGRNASGELGSGGELHSRGSSGAAGPGPERVGSLAASQGSGGADSLQLQRADIVLCQVRVSARFSMPSAQYG